MGISPHKNFGQVQVYVKLQMVVGEENAKYNFSNSWFEI